MISRSCDHSALATNASLCARFVLRSEPARALCAVRALRACFVLLVGTKRPPEEYHHLLGHRLRCGRRDLRMPGPTWRRLGGSTTVVVVGEGVGEGVLAKRFEPWQLSKALLALSCVLFWLFEFGTTHYLCFPELENETSFKGGSSCTRSLDDLQVIWNSSRLQSPARQTLNFTIPSALRLPETMVGVD